MSNATATTTNATSKDAPKQLLVYFGIDDLHEIRVAQAWGKKNNKHVIFSIPLTKLQAHMVLVPVVRGPERTPQVYEEWRPEEQRMHKKTRKPEDLVDEVIECKPIRVADYWRGGYNANISANRDIFELQSLMGELDVNALIDAVNASTATESVFPRTHEGDNHNTLRLTWGS